MHLTNLTTSLLNKSHLFKALTHFYSTSQSSLTRQSSSNKTSAYHRLLSTPPIMNINIEMVMAINELRPKAAFIISNKNAVYAKDIHYSTYNLIECLSFAETPKYFFKTFPLLTQNIAKVLGQGVDFSETGIFKPNAIKKLTVMALEIDSFYGQTFVQLLCVFINWALESSLKTRHTLTQLITPLKNRLQQVHQKQQFIKNSQGSQQSEQTQQTLKALQDEELHLQTEIRKISNKNKIIREEDFLAGLHYCLQKGYYSETILKQFLENILEKNNYEFPDFESFLKEEEYFFNEQPINGMFNRRASIYNRMYINIVYRLKILNQLKKLKIHDPTFMDFAKKNRTSQNSELSESSSEDSPFIDAKKAQDSSSDSQSQEKLHKFDKSLIEESLIPQKAYLNLVSTYLEFFERKDIACFILSEGREYDGFRIMQTEFLSHLNDDFNKTERLLTLSDVKAKYMAFFQEVFDIEKNGTMFVDNVNSEAVFEVILRMFDYGDRKSVWELLKLYERFLLSKNVQKLKSLAPFYTFEKYGYRSNFVAMKLYECIMVRTKTPEHLNTKEDVIVKSMEICRMLSLYFKLLEEDLSTIFDQYELRPGSKGKGQQKEGSSKKVNIRQFEEFREGMDMFLHNYAKLINMVYLQKQNSGFMGKGPQLMNEYVKARFLSSRIFDQALIIDSRPPQDSISNVVQRYRLAIEKKRENLRNVYEKQFKTNSSSVRRGSSQEGEVVKNDMQYTFNQCVHSIMIRRNSLFGPLDQVSTILGIVQTGMELQALKGAEYYEDVLAVFKSIFGNQKMVKLLSEHQTFPEIIKKIVRISQAFKGNYKNESNKLFEHLLNLTKFNLGSYLHETRKQISKQALIADRSCAMDEGFQPYMHVLELKQREEGNMRLWGNPNYKISKQSMGKSIRSDILHTIFLQNAELQRVIRDELARIKTVKGSQRVRNIKFQLNYLQYPYLGNVAINKNNQLIVVLVRRQGAESEKGWNGVVNKYYEDCEKYFRKKGRVVVVTQEAEIRNTLKDLIK